MTVLWRHYNHTILFQYPVSRSQKAYPSASRYMALPKPTRTSHVPLSTALTSTSSKVKSLPSSDTTAPGRRQLCKIPPENLPYCWVFVWRNHQEGLLLLTDINLATDAFKALISHYLHMKLWDVFSHQCLNFNGCLGKPRWHGRCDCHVTSL